MESLAHHFHLPAQSSKFNLKILLPVYMAARLISPFFGSTYFFRVDSYQQKEWQIFASYVRLAKANIPPPPPPNPPTPPTHPVFCANM